MFIKIFSLRYGIKLNVVPQIGFRLGLYDGKICRNKTYNEYIHYGASSFCRFRHGEMFALILLTKYLLTNNKTDTGIRVISKTV